MKPATVLPIVSVALSASLLVMSYANAEIPKLSEEKLQALASHALTGTIERIYEQKEKRGDYEYTYGVAEVAVKRVDKGTDVVANDRVFVRFWRQKWIGDGVIPPGHSGHWDIPTKTDSAEIYVKGDRKTGFDVLSPNGFFKVTKLKTSETNPSP
jgi:hypothetical protein